MPVRECSASFAASMVVLVGVDEEEAFSLVQIWVFTLYGLAYLVMFAILLAGNRGRGIQRVAIRACLKMPQYSRCLVPTCPRLLQVMPEDVSPRDNRDQDHAQRDRFEILCELRRVHARPVLR
jgi:hypothetical protein